MTAYWYALRVKPNKERIVYQLLQAEAVPAYFPSVKVKPVNPRAARVRPYFPGYLFVQADLSVKGNNAFRWTPGAHGLVRYGDTPAIVPDNLVQELRQRLTAIEASGGLILSNTKQGDPVRILSGPFAGYDAIFDAYLPEQERVRVLLAFLSRQPQPVYLGSDSIDRTRQRPG